MISTDKELSDRESEILVLIAQGFSNKEIALRLSISVNTVKVHLRNIFNKTDSRSRTEAAMYAVNAGLVPSVKISELIDTDDLPDILSGNLDNGKSYQTPLIDKVKKLQSQVFTLPVLFTLLVIAIVITRYWTLFAQSQRQELLPATVDSANRWSVLNKLTIPRSSMAAVSYQGSIYTIGGLTISGPINSLERYDPQSDAWETLTPKSLAVSGISAGILGGKFFVPGGQMASGKLTDRVEIYDPRTDRWTLGKNLPEAISGYGLATYEGNLYLFGGWNGQNYLDKVYRYNLQSDSWESLSPLPSPRAYAGVGVAGQKIYIIGGFDGKKALSENLIYSPDLDLIGRRPWSRAADLPSGRYGMGVSTIAEIIEVVGGIQDGDPRIISLSYFPVNDQWQEIGLVESNPSFPGIASLGDYIYIIGGQNKEVFLDQHLAYQAIYTYAFPTIQ